MSFYTAPQMGTALPAVGAVLKFQVTSKGFQKMIKTKGHKEPDS